MLPESASELAAIIRLQAFDRLVDEVAQTIEEMGCRPCSIISVPARS